MTDDPYTLDDALADLRGNGWAVRMANEEGGPVMLRVDYGGEVAQPQYVDHTAPHALVELVGDDRFRVTYYTGKWGVNPESVECGPGVELQDAVGEFYRRDFASDDEVEQTSPTPPLTAERLDGYAAEAFEMATRSDTYEDAASAMRAVRDAVATADMLRDRPPPAPEAVPDDVMATARADRSLLRQLQNDFENAGTPTASRIGQRIAEHVDEYPLPRASE